MKEPIFPRIYHAVPEFVFRGRPLTLTAVLPALPEGEALPAVTVSVEGATAEFIRLCAVEELVYKEGRFVLYETTLPVELLGSAYDLSYTLRLNGKKIGRYTLPFVEEESLPPFIVTEFCGRPGKRPGMQYLEIMNPTSEPIDLYDYRMFHIPGETVEIPEEEMGLPITEEKGTLLLPGEIAVLRAIPHQLHNAEEVDPNFFSTEGFVAAIREMYPYSEDPRSFDGIRVIPLELGYYDEKKGCYLPKPGSLAVTTSAVGDPHTFIITEREGREPLYSLTYADIPFCLDTPVRASSLWTVDLREPRRAKRVRHEALPTPGFLDTCQALPTRADDAAPTVFPLSTRAYYLRDGDMEFRFAVLDRNVTKATLYVKTKNGEYLPLQAEPAGEESVYLATVPYRILIELDALSYYIVAEDSARASTLASREAPFVRALYDNDGPFVSEVYPPNCFALEGEQRPKIRVSYFDRAGIDTEKCVLKIDGKDVSKSTAFGQKGLSYLPAAPLAYGDHTVDLRLTDHLGNRSHFFSRFSVTDGEELFCYRGEVHTHTMHSDGAGYPEQAMAYARDVGKADYFAVTDHSHYLTPEKYARQIEVADLYNEPGKFAALYGWEMTWNYENGYWGHMNVLGTKELVQDINHIPLPEFYRFLEAHPEAVAMFNHPGFSWGNFDDYKYRTPACDRIVCLSEIKGLGYDYEYMLSLSEGWHPAPVYNEDNHSPTWTTLTPSTGYVLAPKLTRENVMDAFRRRRTYMTADPTMKIYYRMNGAWLGSTLHDPKELSYSVKLECESEYGIGKIEIVTEDNLVVAVIDAGAEQKFTFTGTLPALYDYYYVRVLNLGGQYTVTAPVFVEYSEKPLLVKALTLRHSASEKMPEAVSVTVENRGDKPLKNLKVEFYLTDKNGFCLLHTRPFRTVYLDKLKAKSKTVVSRLFPDLPGRRRVTAVVTAESAGQCYSATEFCLLSPLQITAIVPNTGSVEVNGRTVENPYSYIQLFNSSNRELDLSEAQLRLWVKTGKGPVDANILPLTGVRIAPRSLIVVWRRKTGDSLTSEDFNRYYGTRLEEGRSLIIADKPILSSSPSKMRRVDVLLKNEVLARANYNYALGIGKDVRETGVLLYRYGASKTGTAEMVTTEGVIAPDRVEDRLLVPNFMPMTEKKEIKGEKKAKKRAKKQEAFEKAPKVKKSTATALLAAAVTGTAVVASAISAAVATKIAERKDE